MPQIPSYPLKPNPSSADQLIGTDTSAEGGNSTHNFRLGDLQQAVTGVASVKAAAYGAKGDGTSDDTAAIRSAIDANDIVYFPAGTYRVTATISIPSDRVLYGDSMWLSVIKQTNVDRANKDSYYAAMLIDGSSAPKSNIQLRDLGFVGENADVVDIPLGITPALLRIGVPVSDVLVDRCRFENSFGQGVQSYGSDNTARLAIRDCIANHNGETGINVSGYDSIISGNTCIGNAYAGYECVLTRSRFVANYAIENKKDGIAIGGYSGQQFVFPGGHFNVIQGNVAVRNATHGLKIVVGTNNSIISDNICALNGLTGILVNEAGGTVNDKQVTFTRYNTVQSNVCLSNGIADSSNPFGIHITAPNNKVVRNRCADIGVEGYSQRYGILVSSPDCDVVDNDAYNNTLRNYSFENGAANTLFRIDQPEQKGKETYFDATSSPKPSAKLTQAVQAQFDFGPIPPGEMREQQVAVAGAHVIDAVTASPQQPPPPGLMWSGYISNPGVATVRVLNMAAQVVSAPAAWTVAVIQKAG